MKRKFIILVLLTNLCLFYAKAEKADSCFYVQLDLANRWIWRGVAYSEAPVIQPSLGYTNEEWTVSVWGSYPIESRAYSEIDFIIEYQVTSKLKLGFVDYFAINDSTGAKHGFFDMNRETTMHMFDVYCVYQPVQKIPLSFLYSFWFWGADRKAVTNEQNFSSYLEAKYEKEYEKITASTFAGMTFGEGFYASRAAVVNVGIGLSKPITFGNKISIPAKIEFVLNPEMQNDYINAIITLK